MDRMSDQNHDSSSISREIPEELVPRTTFINTANEESEFTDTKKEAKALKKDEDDITLVKNLVTVGHSISTDNGTGKLLKLNELFAVLNEAQIAQIKNLQNHYERTAVFNKALIAQREKLMKLLTETAYLGKLNDISTKQTFRNKRPMGHKADPSNTANNKISKQFEQFLERYQNISILPRTEIPQHTRKFYHTILCIDTSKSMISSKQMTCCCIQQLLREIPEQNQEFEEIISVVCFGKRLRFHEFNPEDQMGHIEFVNNELENQERSWIGCTPLADACSKCISLHNCVKAKLRRNAASISFKGRLVMFTDGKCNSNSIRQNEDDDEYNPSESMQEIYTNLNDLWARFRTENIPIFGIITSYRGTDQDFLVTMAICTNGKVLLRDEITIFAKFIEIEIKAAKLHRHCVGFNWHQIFAYLRLKLGHKDILYFDYATERILRENGENPFNFCNHDCLPRLIRRHPKQGIYGWQQKIQGAWVYFSNELSDEIERGYCASQDRELETLTIETQSGNQQIDVLRFDFTNFSYRNIDNDDPEEKIYVRRVFMGNDWG